MNIRIQNEPYTSPTSSFGDDYSSTFPTSYQYCGYLHVQNNAFDNNKWNKKFFMISNNFLLSAVTRISSKLDEIIYLEGSNIVYSKNNKSDHIFQLITENQDLLYFKTSSPEQCTLWINAIDKASRLKIKDIYRFLYILGRSGTTKVVAAIHKITLKQSAIKIVNKRICDKNRLKTEIDILKKLDNEYIVKLDDVIETKVYLYIAMEMCVGGELFDRIIELDGNHYTEYDSCLIMHQIAKGVKSMHSLGIIHRDLKPENILCVEPQSVRKIKIADFGISKFFDDCEIDDKTEAMDTMICSISYTAPEILENKKYDCRADYYSIGVILYILLCGYPPFGDDEDQSDDGLIETILNDEIVFDDADWEHVSEETKDLVKGLLDKDPKTRKTCDGVLKLVWKVTNCSNSFEKAREKFKKHVMKTKMKSYSSSTYNLAQNEIFDDTRKKLKRMPTSTSCSSLHSNITRSRSAADAV